jgi:hypothetical protein
VVFQRMMRAFGAGGPSIDTVPANPHTRPGRSLDGQVHVVGGDQAVDIEHIALGLVTRVEHEGHDIEYDSTVEFARVAVAGAFGWMRPSGGRSRFASRYRGRPRSRMCTASACTAWPWGCAPSSPWRVRSTGRSGPGGRARCFLLPGVSDRAPP